MSIQVSHDWQEGQWDWPLQHNDGVVKVHNTPEKFEVGLDAQYFTPNEIQVKVVGNLLEIHFEHQVRNDAHGSVSRAITRSYKLPDDVDAASVKSHLSTRGVLVISASKKH